MASSPLLDLACIHAAACDVALVDTAFRAAASPSTKFGMIAALHAMHEGAFANFPRSPGAEGLTALMDLQLYRLKILWVRALFPAGEQPRGRCTARKLQQACKVIFVMPRRSCSGVV